MSNNQISSEKPLSEGQAFSLSHLDLLAYVACPFRQCFRAHLEEVINEHHKSTGRNLKCHIPMGCGESDEYDNVSKIETIDDFPNVVASVGFDDFFDPRFVERLVTNDAFQTAWATDQNAVQSVHESFKKAGFLDPQGWYTPYSVWPYVMLVDKAKLGDLPLPRRWSDLLDPCYRDQIISDGAHNQKFASAPLLSFYKEHGAAGLVQFATNIRESLHPAQIVKIAGTSNTEGAAIYILPWSFARAHHRPNNVPLIWPEDGAISSPIYAMVKRRRHPDVDVIVQTLIGPELGEQSARAGFPSLNSKVNNELPEGASFKWLGWDYLRSHDVTELIKLTSTIATDAWTRKGTTKPC